MCNINDKGLVSEYAKSSHKSIRKTTQLKMGK